MNNLFNPTEVSELLRRIGDLNPGSQRQWGKMTVTQMLSHCTRSMETAMGQNVIKRLFIGRIVAPFLKKSVLGEKPFGKNSPTDKSYIFKDQRDFGEEKSKAIDSVKLFFERGAPGCTTQPHPFFGKFTPEEWAIFQWKHWDHHLRQFGV